VTRGASAAVLALLLVAACEQPGRPNLEFVPEMVDSIPYEPLAANPITRDGRTFQAAPAGVVARSGAPFEYDPGPKEAERAARELTSPLPAPAPDAVARGQEVFTRICATCHGSKGQGDGPIIPRFPAPPPLDAPHARALADGQLFHILMRGQGLMPSHAAQVAPADRWPVVAFVRSLQQAGPGGVK